MSGIYGVLRRDGAPVESATLARMAAALSHRGPDGGDVYHDGPVALGAMLRARVPGRGEVAPLHAAEGLAIVADARLDNRAEIGDLLRLPRSEPATDAALMLAAYRRWGGQAAEYLLGDFACAVWDAARQQLFCARDHSGLRQLYYYSDAHLFAFASEIKALLTLPNVGLQPDERRLGELLTLEVSSQEATLYRDIRRLAPATCLTVGRERSSSRTYWRLDPGHELRYRADEQYVEQFASLLGVAVRCRMGDGEAVATALSGGLDSSAITCVARDIRRASGGDPLPTFSVVFDAAPSCDERPYIEAVAGMGGIAPHYVHSEQLGPLTDWDGDDRADEPLWNPQAAPTWAAYKAAREAGVRVYLEGVGGDDVLGQGGDYMAELLLHGRLITLAREAAGVGRRHGVSPWRLVARQARQLHRGATASSAAAPLREDFRRRIGLTDPMPISAPRTQREMQWRRLAGATLPSVGLAFMDRAAARLGLEVRCPLLDRRLIEFCLALPPRLKLHDGLGRWIARRALVGVLPEEVRLRARKTSLTPALAYGLREIDRPLLDDLLLHNPGPIAEYVAMDEVAARYRRFLAQPQAGDELLLWNVALLGRWLRRGRSGAAA